MTDARRRAPQLLPNLWILLVAALAVSPHASGQAKPEPDRKPGHYHIWASADQSVCHVVKTGVNSLPDQDLVKESNRGGAAAIGILAWTPGPSLLDRVNPGDSLSFYNVSHLLRDIGGNGELKYVLRYTGYLSGTETDSLYVLRRLPGDGEEMREIFRSVQPSYSGNIHIDSWKRAHGDDWKDWYMAGQVYVAVMFWRRPLFLAAHNIHRAYESTDILVFTFDGDGTRKDVCMLRRICSCDPSCGKPFVAERERTELLPNAKYCQRSGAPK